MTKKTTIPIAIADDHIMVRDSIRNMITTFQGYEVVVAADNGKHLIELLKKAKPFPEICILDIQMPEMNGFEAMAHIKKNWPELKVLALSMLDDEFSIIRMLRGGAKGYLLKGDNLDDLHNAIDCINNKGFYSSELVASNFFHMVEEGHTNDVLYKITEKEMTFLKYCCTELSVKEIADRMAVSTSTAQGYRSSLFDKLNLKTRQGLAIFAIKSGVVSLGEL